MITTHVIHEKRTLSHTTNECERNTKVRTLSQMKIVHAGLIEFHGKANVCEDFIKINMLIHFAHICNYHMRVYVRMRRCAEYLHAIHI